MHSYGQKQTSFAYLKFSFGCSQLFSIIRSTRLQFKSLAKKPQPKSLLCIDKTTEILGNFSLYVYVCKCECLCGGMWPKSAVKNRNQQPEPTTMTRANWP